MNAIEGNLDIILANSEKYIRVFKYYFLTWWIGFSIISVLFILLLKKWTGKGGIKGLTISIIIVLIISGILGEWNSQNEINKINEDIALQRFCEYHGEILYDSTLKTLTLIRANVKMYVSDGKSSIFTNFVKLPVGYSNGYIVYLEKSKAVVLYIPDE